MWLCLLMNQLHSKSCLEDFHFGFRLSAEAMMLKGKACAGSHCWKASISRGIQKNFQNIRLLQWNTVKTIMTKWKKLCIIVTSLSASKRNVRTKKKIYRKDCSETYSNIIIAAGKSGKCWMLPACENHLSYSSHGVDCLDKALSLEKIHSIPAKCF